MNTAAAILAAVERPSDYRWTLFGSGEVRAFPANIVSAHMALYYLQTPGVESLQQRGIRVRACFEAGGSAIGCAHEVTRLGPGYTDLVPDPCPAAVHRVAIIEFGGAA
ncbi:MAG: hypothetical protein ACRDS9_18895 [Pseudonocardiaceae bacterium]